MRRSCAARSSARWRTASAPSCARNFSRFRPVSIRAENAFYWRPSDGAIGSEGDKMAERRRLRLWRALALIVLCLAGFAGAAVAGNPGNGNGNGNSASAPGQEKKTESQQQASPSQQASSQSGSQGSSANAPGHTKPAFKPAPASTPKKKSPPTVSSSVSAGASGKAKTNGEKVLVCHKTGWATNPYVVIAISLHGWIHGHSKHPGDILLGPSFPGDHRKDASRCV